MAIVEKDKFKLSCNRGSAPFFLVGLATGVALALLLAPRSGAGMRRLIGRTVKEREDWVKAKSTAAQDYIRSQGADLRDRVKDVAEVIGRSSAPAGV
jgi:gas vesicle protein